jgi:uncharacterized OsmC-like protein
MASNVRPKETVATFTLSAHGSGVAQTVRPGGSAYEIAIDAPSAFGGRDSAPSPISYALASFVSCSQVTAQIVAKELGLRLGGFRFELAADLDTAVMVGGSREANGNFERIAVEANIETDAAPERFALLKEETERRCPIFQLFSRSGVDLQVNWHAEALK